MVTMGRKMFGRSGTKSIGLAEVEGLEASIEHLNFLWTGNPVAGIIPELAKNANYQASVKEVQRLQGMVGHSLR